MSTMKHLAPLLLLLGCSTTGNLESATESTSTGTDASTDASTGADTSTDTSTGAETDTPTETTGVEPSGLVLTDVDAFQVVAVPLMDEGIEVPTKWRPAPIVADRAVVLRASVQVPPEWSPQEVELSVDVTLDGMTSTYTSMTTLATSFDPDDASSGLTVDLPAEAVQLGATYALSLYAGEANPALRFPDAGEAELSPVETGTITIHIVPFEVDGLIPDTSESVIDGFAEAVYAYYPTTGVDISVGDVQPNPYPDLPVEQVLGDALYDVGVLMEQIDHAPVDTYYYGLMQPAATREEYEGTTGSSQELDQRAGFAIGAGFGDALSESTLVHELGHLHFLKHAPCGEPSNTDPLFPHSDGMAHTEGFDVRSGTFIDVDEATDVMSYCQPRWVSAYHYEKMAAWVKLTQTW